LTAASAPARGQDTAAVVATEHGVAAGDGFGFGDRFGDGFAAEASASGDGDWRGADRLEVIAGVAGDSAADVGAGSDASRATSVVGSVGIAGVADSTAGAETESIVAARSLLTFMEARQKANAARTMVSAPASSTRVRLVKSTGVAGLLAAIVLVGISGCNTNPHTPDITAPPQVEPAAEGSQHTPGHLGVQLPSTISLSYDHPLIMDVPHQMVLWNASQAIKAELAAMYQKTSGATPDLARYWTGDGYKGALAHVDAWIAAKQQPVGRVVVTGTTVESITAQQATVTFCQDLTKVRKGIERTNSIQAPVQAKDANGDRLTLTMTPTGPRGAWQVAGVTTVKGSAQCPPLDNQHRGKRK